MNNYQDDETGIPLQEKIFTWGRFLLYLLLGVILLIISFPFSSVLLINPYPFVLLFSLGSLLFLVAIIQVVEYKVIFKQPGTFIYLTCLIASIYTGVFRIGYISTLGIMGLQLLSLLYLMISQFPGGQNSIKNYIGKKFTTK